MNVSEACYVHMKYAVPFEIARCYFYNPDEYYKMFLYRVFTMGAEKACIRYRIPFSQISNFTIDLIQRKFAVQYSDGAVVEFIRYMCKNRDFVSIIEKIYSEQRCQFCSEFNIKIQDDVCLTSMKDIGNVNTVTSGYTIVKCIEINKNIDLCDEDTMVYGVDEKESSFFAQAYLNRCLTGSMDVCLNNPFTNDVIRQSYDTQVTSADQVLLKASAFRDSYSQVLEEIKAFLICGISLCNGQTFNDVLRKAVFK